VESESPEGVASKTAKMTILVAEDDPHDQMLLVMAAEDCGVDVDITIDFANDGAELLAELKRRAAASAVPELVVLDMRMPMLDGHDVLDALRDDATLPDVRVGVFSSSYRQQDIDRSLQKGAAWHEVKPSRYEELVEFVERIATQFAPKPANHPEIASATHP